MTYYYKRVDEAGNVVNTLTYNNFHPNITDSLTVEISVEEYDVLSYEFAEKASLADKLYRGEITVNDVPEAWQKDVQARVDDFIESMGTYDSQDISADEALDIIVGGDEE